MRSPNVVMLQTSDADLYVNLLAVTGKMNEAYCQIYGVDYRPFIGLKRGYHPWHATFNRILLLSEIKNDTSIDWVVYLDADAYVHDVEFSIPQYLMDKNQYSLVIEPGGHNGWWDVNAGVFFMNLKHPISRRLIDLWEAAFLRKISDSDLQWSVSAWSLAHDQTILQEILRNNPEFESTMLILDRYTINYARGRIIRQALRGPETTLDSRIEYAKKDILPILSRIELGLPPKDDSESTISPAAADSSILEGALRDAASFARPHPDPGLDGAVVMEQFTQAMYRCLLLREPEARGLANHINNLHSGRLNFESALTSCLRSPEFQKKIPYFLERYLASEKETGTEQMDYVRLLAMIKRVLMPSIYLEVGVAGGASLASDPIPEVVIGIDPKPTLSDDAKARLSSAAKFIMLTATSDQAFAELLPGQHLDGGLVGMSFVDGLHHSDVALRDVANCARLSREGAPIIVHDVLPATAEQAQRQQCPGVWAGDVYKIVYIISTYFPDIPKVLLRDVPPTGLFIMSNKGNVYKRIMDKYQDAVYDMENMDFNDTMKQLWDRTVSWTSSEFTRFLVEAAQRRQPLETFAHNLLRDLG